MPEQQTRVVHPRDKGYGKCLVFTTVHKSCSLCLHERTKLNERKAKHTPVHFSPLALPLCLIKTVMTRSATC
jgi:hypothetical protein